MNQTSVITRLSAKKNELIILAAWFITTLIYLNIYGIVSGMEAEKYIFEANFFIEHGSFSAPRYWFYIITISFLIISFKLKLGIIGAFVLQGIFNIFAYLFFYQAIKKHFQKDLTALFIVLYLLLFLPYQSWVVFLFTESTFFSAILILFSILLTTKSNSIINLTKGILALILVIVARPLGILFIGGTILYYITIAPAKWKKILSFLLVLFSIGGYYCVNVIFSTINDWHITQAFEQESIICNLPSANPSNVKLDLAADGSPVYKLLYYLSHNVSHFLHFAGIKLQYFFLMTRPYYSSAHNYFLLINSIVIYSFIIAGFFIKQVYQKPISIFIFGSIVLYALTIVIQCDDYQNRFVLSIYPLFIFLAGMIAENLALRFFKNNK